MMNRIENYCSKVSMWSKRVWKNGLVGSSVFCVKTRSVPSLRFPGPVGRAQVLTDVSLGAARTNHNCHDQIQPMQYRSIMDGGTP